MAMLMLIANIIFKLIELWLMLKKPAVAEQYRVRVKTVLERAKRNGVCSHDFDELMKIRDDIKSYRAQS